MPIPPRHAWSTDDLLSRARLAPYRAACSGDNAAAMRLYGWNVAVSAAFHECLHYLEIGLRNAMDRQLILWATGRGLRASWYSDPAVPLTRPTRRKVQAARAHATKDGRPEVHGKVIAELMLGFWLSLLADEYNRRLWQPCLRHAFDGPVRRVRLHTALDDLRRLRNRIAHHEPIHGRDLDADHDLLLDTAGRISPLLRSRVERTTRVPAVLANRP